MPKFFIPARNSRHRTACFALYKALVRQGRRVPLPDDLAASSGGGSSGHPIQAVVRNSFRQNRGDTSPRLVVAALNNGYKFLDLLAKAQTPSSAAHTSVVAFLEKRVVGTGQAWTSRQKKSTTLPSAPRPGTVPLLTRRPIPGVPPGRSRDNQFAYYYYEYVPTERPLPLSALSGGSSVGDGGDETTSTKAATKRRRVPTLATDATGIPFLRLGRPQSPVLSRVIRQKGQKRRARAELVTRLLREELPFAAEEDQWEAVLARNHPETAAAVASEDESTYAQGVQVGINYLNAKLSVEMADMRARSKALLQLVDAERALAKQEAEAREVAARQGKTATREGQVTNSNRGKKASEPEPLL